MIRLACLILCCVAVLVSNQSFAHEVRPAYLEIRETAPQRYDVLWKRPIRGAATAQIGIRLPKNCTDTVPAVSLSNGGASVQRRSIHCSKSLAGQKIVIEGLSRTLVETIVRFQRLDGATQTKRLMAGSESFIASRPSTIVDVATAYLPLGIEHILLGFDHLCFVLALLLLIKGFKRLLWAITAFTVAHSLTLSAATLGYVSTPSGPVEALIAFSIVLVAAEIVAVRRGRGSATAERPWIVAFGFGLLHGLGFAGALSETGLPSDAIPLALLFFNVGVELGQLAFVVVAMVVLWIADRYTPSMAARATLATAYGIGVLAAFWSIERVVRIIV